MHAPSLASTWLAIAFVVFASGTAEALTLQTPFVRVNSDQHIRVFVTNLGTKLIDVAVTCRNSVGGVYTPVVDECTSTPLEGGFTCDFVLAANQGGFCIVESSSGKVRAAIGVLGGPASAASPLVAVIPATKK